MIRIADALHGLYRDIAGEQPAATVAALAQPAAVVDITAGATPRTFTVPAWAVAQCSTCLRFLRKGEYLVCRLCRKQTCKQSKCKNIHGGVHLAQANRGQP